jgi:hypothetical protein
LKFLLMVMIGLGLLLVLVVDGIYSTIKYATHPFHEQIIRSIRTKVGVTILFIVLFKIRRVEKHSAKLRIKPCKILG